ncbi:MAG: hypothetical protein IKZ48_00810 [Prevotella sp.]|nr:hypothetical protein [Prevotella sp.]
MKKNLFLAALALVALASCTDSEFVGDNSPTNPNTGPGAEKAIVFNSGANATTRANHVGADAADLLGGKFIVEGFKGNGSTMDVVFNNYYVNWTANTAGKTESNTSDWEYVGTAAAAPSTLPSGATQSIKYWDYNTSQYDFAAYSTGKLAAANVLTTGDPGDGQVLISTITKASTYAGPTYTLKGDVTGLKECYISDLVTAYKTNGSSSDYNKEVQLSFRKLASKVRVAFYETVPGYSVKEVEFYQDDATTEISANISSNTTATLIGTFNNKGTYTISFPTIGSTKKTESDYNKAHVAFVPETSGTSTTATYGTLNYGAREHFEAEGNYYLGRTSKYATFAGTADVHYYTDVLPNETSGALELRINYKLVSTDGSGEVITVHGAKAFIPSVYATWKPNYAYTYIFKIGDNTNGWTSTVTSDPTGLYPITFDAVVVDAEDNTQSTITTVATPSITTYQKGHDVTKDGYKDEYKVPSYATSDDAKTNDAIYAQVMVDGAIKNDLNATDPATKSFFYTITENPYVYVGTEPANWPAGYYTDAACTTPVTASFSAGNYYRACTEVDVMDALNIRTSGDATTVVGRNGVTLTPGASGTTDYTVTQIPGVDGNWITKYDNSGTPTNITAGMVAKLTPNAAGTYAYVYYTGTDAADTDIYSAVQLTGETAPDNFTTKYFKQNSDGTFTSVVAGDYKKNGYFYEKYTNDNKVYGVKVIKVVD